MSVATHRKRHDVPGPKREERLLAEAEQRTLLPGRRRDAAARAAMRGSLRDAVGLKCWFVPGSSHEELGGVLTPYASKTLRRRRAAGRAARLARRRRSRRW